MLVCGGRLQTAARKLLRERRSQTGEHDLYRPFTHPPDFPGGVYHSAGRSPLAAYEHQDLLERAVSRVCPPGLLPRGLLPVCGVQEPQPHEVDAQRGGVPRHPAEKAQNCGEAGGELATKRQRGDCLGVRSQGLPDPQ